MGPDELLMECVLQSTGSEQWLNCTSGDFSTHTYTCPKSKVVNSVTCT